MRGRSRENLAPRRRRERPFMVPRVPAREAREKGDGRAFSELARFFQRSLLRGVKPMVQKLARFVSPVALAVVFSPLGACTIDAPSDEAESEFREAVPAGDTVRL